MTASFSVDLDELESLEARLRGFGAHLEEQLIELARRATMLEASWGGGAAEKYIAAQQQWLGDARQMRAGLDTMAHAVEIARLSYSSAIRANTAMFRG